MTGYFEGSYGEIRYPLATDSDPGFREAQLVAAHAVSAHFFSRREPAIVTMPTGSGKTAVMALCAYMLRSRRVLVVTPSRLVRDQIGRAFRDLRLLRDIGAVPGTVGNPRVCVVDGILASAEAWTRLRDVDVVVGTPQSISPAVGRVSAPPEDMFDLLLVDEAHHSPAKTWKAVLSAFPPAKAVLLTATPFRRDRREIPGRIVFAYGIARARDDGVYGRLEFVPVDATGSEDDADATIATQAAARLRADQGAGLDHRIMVRTATKNRAKALLEIYSERTDLRLKVVTANNALSHVLRVVDQVKAGDLDGIICVDMLGEGFDLPQLVLSRRSIPASSHRSIPAMSLG